MLLVLIGWKEDCDGYPEWYGRYGYGWQEEYDDADSF